MTHKHEWRMGYPAICDCLDELPCEEVDRRIGATEELTAEDALQLAGVALDMQDKVWHMGNAEAAEFWQNKVRSLRAYADKLEEC